MPQLDFTIWLSNALINWTFFIMLFIYLNSPSNSISLYTTSAQENGTTTNSNNWNWS